MGAALVAVIDRARRRVRLDPQVRPGTRLAYDGEAVLLHTTSTGHAGETADYLARVLRRNGWRVTVSPVDEQPALVGVAAYLGPAMMPDATLDSLVQQIGAAHGHELAAAKSTTQRSRYEPRAPGGHLVVCLTCGHGTKGERNVDSHRRNRGHHDFKRLPTAEALALQAQVRAAHAQASAPEAQEAPSGLAG